MTRLTPQLLLGAYASGIFPMAESRHDRDLFWIDPEVRGILPLKRFHIPRSLRKTLRRDLFEVRCDTAFAQVIRACAESTTSRPETWINPEIERLYSALHDMGFAHSVECWQGGRLLGGLYGVALGGAFFGESMFSRVRDASKVALCHLVARLRRGKYVLLDTQFVTDHLKLFGAIEIPRRHYRNRLTKALQRDARFQPGLRDDEFADFIQSITQTS
ncbi:MAG: leucyl/phenylalanyl-tRNA--protein transferase [Alphaproteobacteria bacterium]